MPQIKSKKRVSERGEVFTAQKDVDAMLDLVKDECLRPDSRFLEPACGDGNFLAAILKRKLSKLRSKYKKSRRDYEKQAVVAISSLYGIDIMQDNVELCRQRLFKIWQKEYTSHCKGDSSEDTLEAVKFIINKNIVNGNALSLMCVDEEGNDTEEPIVFSEWALISGTEMQRSDYKMEDLVLSNTLTNSDSSTNQNKDSSGGVFLQRYVTHYKKVQQYGY